MNCYTCGGKGKITVGCTDTETGEFFNRLEDCPTCQKPKEPKKIHHAPAVVQPEQGKLAAAYDVLLGADSKTISAGVGNQVKEELKSYAPRCDRCGKEILYRTEVIGGGMVKPMPAACGCDRDPFGQIATRSDKPS